MVNALRAAALPDPPLAGNTAEDPDDGWLLALADLARVDWLVTGDRRSGLHARNHIGRARIATASVFVELALQRM